MQKLWPPLNAVDYGGYVGQIKTDVGGVYAGFAGINGLRFLKQYNEYGLSKIPVFGNPTCVDEGIRRNMGDEALGVYSASWYSAALDTPTNRKWVQTMRGEYKEDPGYCTIGGYLGMLFLEAGMKAVQGRIEDKGAFMKAAV